MLWIADGPSVMRWSSGHDFLDAAHDFLAAREAEHCLLFGISSTIASHPDVYPDPRFWTVHEAGRVVAAALRTPPSASASSPPAAASAPCSPISPIQPPTSNHIYQAVGYTPVVDVDQYLFPA